MMTSLSAWLWQPRVTPCWFRPLMPLTVLFALGIVSRSLWPELQLWALAAASAALALTGWQFRADRRSWWSPLLLFWALGYMALTPWLPDTYPPNHIIHFTDGSRYHIVGTVDGAPRSMPDRRLRMVVRVEKISLSGNMQSVTGRLRLSVFGDAPEIRTGDRLAFKSRLRPIRNFGNPGGFDYQRYMAFQRIAATAWTREPGVEKRAAGRSLPDVFDRIRNRSRDFIETELTGDSQAVMKALTIGDRGALSTPLRDVFNRIGIGHLLAISGLHVGIIAIVLMGTLKWCFHRIPFFLASGSGHAAAVGATIPFILAYGLIAGMAPSTQRAVLMVSLGLGAYLVRREGDTLNLIAVAGLLILIWHPPMIFAVGFQMSFAAVLAIVLGLRLAWPGSPPAHHSGRNGVGHRLLTFMAVTLYATAGTLPLLMYYFQQFSLVGLVANLMAVPLVGFAALPLGLLSLGLLPFSAYLASICIQTGGFLLDIVMTAAQWVAQFEFVAVQSFQPTGLEIGGFYILLAALLAIRSHPQAKWLLTAAVVLLVVDAGWWYHYRIRHRDLRLTVLDVGQGSATLVEFPGGRTMLVDGGGYADNRIFDMGRLVVGPFLRHRKILTVDYLVLSHPSSDHMNGLFHVVRQFHPRVLVWNDDQVENSSAKAFVALINATQMRIPSFEGLDRKMVIGGVGVQIVNPPPDFDHRRNQERWRSLNNNSIALRLTFGGHAVLISGDIERPAELEMLRRMTPFLKSSVLLVPHHGSRTSSSAEFLKAVAPDVAIVSCGWRNRFGFPHPEIVARYQEIGSRLLRTDINGAIQIRIQPSGLQFYYDDHPAVQNAGSSSGGTIAPAGASRRYPGRPSGPKMLIAE